MRDWVARWGPFAVIVLLLTVVVVGISTTDPAPRDRAQELEQRLRCPVCKTVSIAESPSETASEMRRIVAEQVNAKRSDEEIIAYFENRYGEWVLLDPPVEGRTLLLWVLPALAAAGGASLLGFRARSAAQRPVVPLSSDDRERVSAAMEEFRLSRNKDDEP